MKRASVIVIGSNSTRMVTADLGSNLQNIQRRRFSTRLFLHMQNGLLSPDAISATVQGIQKLIAQSDAPVLGVYATSAVRDAANANELNDAIQAACHLPLTILSGQEEASASFYGASGNTPAGVIDIGGGSTEIAIGHGMQVQHSVSLQLGASRLFTIQPINSKKDVSAALAYAEQMLHKTPQALIAHTAIDLFYLIGGTGTSAAGLLYATEEIEGLPLYRNQLYDALCEIAAVPSAQRANIPHFPARRADILPTGMAILIATMDALHLSQVTVTQRSNADGLLRTFVQTSDQT